MKKIQLIALLAGLMGASVLFGAQQQDVPMQITSIKNLTENPIRIRVNTHSAWGNPLASDMKEIEPGASYEPEAPVYQVEVIDALSYITGIVYEPFFKGLVVRNMFGKNLGVFKIKPNKKLKIQINNVSGAYTADSTALAITISKVK